MKRQQQIDYYDSLKADILKDITRDRKLMRDSVQKVLQSKVSHVAEGRLSPEDNRLLRVYRMRPMILTDREKIQGQAIVANLKRIEMGGCYNLSTLEETRMKDAGSIMKLDIPGVPFKICISFMESLRGKAVNETLGMVDVFIHMDLEVYRYPLAGDEVEDFMGLALSSGVDLENRGLYPPMVFSDLEEVIDNLRQVKVGGDTTNM